MSGKGRVRLALRMAGVVALVPVPHTVLVWLKCMPCVQSSCVCARTVLAAARIGRSTSSCCWRWLWLWWLCDVQATTPIDPRVLDAMMPFLTEQYGNPHSRTHAYGWTAESAVEKAREEVASLIGADPKEIVFTSVRPVALPCSAAPNASAFTTALLAHCICLYYSTAM